MKSYFQKICLIVISVLLMGGMGLPVLASDNDKIITNLNNRIAKLKIKIEREENKEKNNEIRVAVNASVRAAEVAYQTALRQAKAAWRTAQQNARLQYRAALTAAAGNATARVQVLTSYRQALSTAKQQYLQTQLAARQQLLIALQAAHFPIANSQTVHVAENTAVAITLTGSDANNHSLTFAVVKGPTHGSLSGTAPQIVYTPNTNFHGTDHFTFTVSDGSNTSLAAKVKIEIANSNDVPVATAQNRVLAINTPTIITLTGSDANGCANTTFTYNVTSQPNNGTIVPTTGAVACANGQLTASVIYLPVTNFTGTTAFNFTLSDGPATSSVTTVTLHVQ